MKVLVIYELVPEEIKAYVVEGEDAELAINCHRKYLNSDDIPELEELSLVLEGKEELDSSSPLSAEGYDSVVFTGFIL